MSKTFGIRITAQARHADLWEAAQLMGGQSALARFLKLGPSTVGLWINLRSCPCFPEDYEFKSLCEKRISKTRKSLNRLEKRLFKITGKTIEQIWPAELRSAIRGGEIVSRIDFRKEVEISRLISDSFKDRNLLPSPEAMAINKETGELVQCLMRTLPFRWRTAICMRFGLMGEPESSYTEIAKRLSTSNKNVYEILKKALARLKVQSEKLGIENLQLPFSDNTRVVETTAVNCCVTD